MTRRGSVSGSPSACNPIRYCVFIPWHGQSGSRIVARLHASASAHRVSYIRSCWRSSRRDGSLVRSRAGLFGKHKPALTSIHTRWNGLPIVIVVKASSSLVIPALDIPKTFLQAAFSQALCRARIPFHHGLQFGGLPNIQYNTRFL